MKILFSDNQISNEFGSYHVSVAQRSSDVYFFTKCDDLSFFDIDRHGRYLYLSDVNRGNLRALIAFEVRNGCVNYKAFSLAGGFICQDLDINVLDYLKCLC